MKKWTRPIFEQFDVNGEVTAYAGAWRADIPPGGAGASGDPTARQEAIAPGPALGADRAGGPGQRSS